MEERADAVILVVDDRKDQLDLSEARLDDHYDVRTAQTGEKALERIDDDVDVVLLDREMPGMSGDEVLEYIREEDYDCRVAMVTAVEPEIDVLALGFDAYLTKPVSADVLLETIDRLLRRSEYSDSIAELFTLCERRAVLLETHTEDELEDSAEYAELTEKIREYREETDDIARHFSSEDYRVTFRDLD